jgi:hypothetical protein
MGFILFYSLIARSRRSLTFYLYVLPVTLSFSFLPRPDFLLFIGGRGESSRVTLLGAPRGGAGPLLL